MHSGEGDRKTGYGLFCSVALFPINKNNQQKLYLLVVLM